MLKVKGKIRDLGINELALGMLVLGLVLSIEMCFCTLFPFTLAVSFIFNAIFIGSNLFASLAQEREKCTLDALRLTQLTSFQILLLKSQKELRYWGIGNLALLVALFATALVGNVNPVWFVLGFLSMAASGLLSMGLALAVSTRSETTASAVVRGWVAKGAWLLGLPLLDQTIGSVAMSDKTPSILSNIDPLWVAKEIAEATLFETHPAVGFKIFLGVIVSAVLAYGLARQSSGLIDAAFDSSATITDDKLHPIYRKTLAANMHENPFFLREMAWQLRSGAGKWPGYLVFVTLFLAPFLYGMSRVNVKSAASDIKVVREGIITSTRANVSSMAVPAAPDASPTAVESLADSQKTLKVVREHSMLCLLSLMNFPIYQDLGADGLAKRTVMNSKGEVLRLSPDELNNMRREPSRLYNGGSDSIVTSIIDSKSAGSMVLKSELSYCLMMGLILTIIYLLIRGGAFVAAAVTGERERRSWDQISLTGAEPSTYIRGKLAAVLALPLLQLLAGSLVLVLFVGIGVMSLVQYLLVVVLLCCCFVLAAAMGMAFSTICSSSQNAQGATLVFCSLLLTLPLFPNLCGPYLSSSFYMSAKCWFLTLHIGHLILSVILLALLVGGGKPILRSEMAGRSAGCMIILLAIWICGPLLSPIASVMRVCGSLTSWQWSEGILGIVSPTSGLLVSIAALFSLGCLFYSIACSRLEDGGSIS